VEFFCSRVSRRTKHWDRFAGAVRQLIEPDKRDAPHRVYTASRGSAATRPRPDRTATRDRSWSPVRNIGARLDAEPAAPATIAPGAARRGRQGRDGASRPRPALTWPENGVPGAAMAWYTRSRGCYRLLGSRAGPARRGAARHGRWSKSRSTNSERRPAPSVQGLDQ